MPEEYLTIGEVAERMGVGTGLIKSLRKNHGLPYEKWGERTIRYPWGKVESWIDEGGPYVRQ